MFDLKKYMKEILNIAKVEDKPVDVGLDMFLANIRNADDKTLPYYKGAENINFKALKKEYEKMSGTELSKMISDVNNYINEKF